MRPIENKVFGKNIMAKAKNKVKITKPVHVNKGLVKTIGLGALITFAPLALIAKANANKPEAKVAASNSLKINENDTINYFDSIPKLSDIKNVTFLDVANLTEDEIKAISKTTNAEIDSFNAQSEAPNPQIEVMGYPVIARIVVQKSTHSTFVYDDDGKFSYKVSNAVGKKSTPTDNGIRYITKIGEYPYNQPGNGPSPRMTPECFGDNIIYVRRVDSKTGKTFMFGEWLHGTNNPNSIGKDASHGCMRHGKEDLSKLVNSVNLGEFVNIIN